MESRNTAIFDACQCPASSSDEVRAVFVDAPSRVLGAAKGRLGIYARTASPPLDIGQVRREARAERWRLKWAADTLRDGRQRGCHRARQREDKAVTVEVGTPPGAQYRRAYYGGLQTCGSVWGCPLCAARISEVRRVELQAALDAARRLGLRVALLTLTIRHGIGDDIRDLLARMRVARRRLVSGKAGAQWTARCGIVGSIKALEVTYGTNGWHPHYHVLLITRADGAALDEMQAGYTTRWINACVAAGLPAPLPGVACKVQDGQHAAKYVSKWGLAEEMTKAHLKRSRARAGRTPWDLLRAYADREVDGARAGQLWAEYAAAFKGQRQLYWSNGLRALLGLGVEQSDTDIAAAVDHAAVVLASLSDIERQALVSMHALGDILNIAETAPEHVQIAIDSMVKLHLCNIPAGERRFAVQRVMREMADLAG